MEQEVLVHEEIKNKHNLEKEILTTNETICNSNEKFLFFLKGRVVTAFFLYWCPDLRCWCQLRSQRLVDTFVDN
jgi:hypothetical protein